MIFDTAQSSLVTFQKNQITAPGSFESSPSRVAYQLLCKDKSNTKTRKQIEYQAIM